MVIDKPKVKKNRASHDFFLKSQSALEYILVVALTFAIIVPTTYLFYNYSKESSQEIKDSQITQLGRTIVDNAQLIFYSGEGSKTELDVNVPDNINKAEIIDEREIVFNGRTSFGDLDVVFFSSVPLETKKKESCSGDSCEMCSASRCRLFNLDIPGLKKIKISAIKKPNNKDAIKIEVI